MAESEDELETHNLKVGANELLGFQRDLKQERELLQKILTKIDDQIHRLQVEQLHLLGEMNKSLKAMTDEPYESKETSKDDQEDHEASTSKSLDLSIASIFKYFEEEIEEDEDEMQIKKIL